MSLQVRPILSRALKEVSQDVSAAVEKAFGVADFSRTLALQIHATWGGGRVMRFAGGGGFRATT
jgi:hypothetical protein